MNSAWLDLAAYAALFGVFLVIRSRPYRHAQRLTRRELTAADAKRGRAARTFVVVENAVALTGLAGFAAVRVLRAGDWVALARAAMVLLAGLWVPVAALACLAGVQLVGAVRARYVIVPPRNAESWLHAALSVALFLSAGVFLVLQLLR